MIVDCYTHAWDSDSELGLCLPPSGSRKSQQTSSEDQPNHGFARHLAASEPVDVTILVGFKSSHLNANIHNEKLAEYISAHSDRIIGFAGIDPSDPKAAIEDMKRGRDEFGMKGFAIAPSAQDYHPTSSQAMRVYAEAEEMRMPLLVHSGVHLCSKAKLEYARPFLLDEVAREMPELKIIIAHVGHPWTQETILLLAKHDNVFAEVSWLLRQPWQAYTTLLSAHQMGVIDKLLFGSGFPLATASECIEEIYGINHLCQGNNLPAIPREQIRGIVERDTLELLGIDHAARQTPPLRNGKPTTPADLVH